MKPLLIFGGACLLVFVIVAAISVYGFGQYERAWGRGGSFQVETWLSLVGAVIAMGSFGISSALLQRVHAQNASFVLGAACALVYISLCWVFNGISPPTGLYLAFFLLVAVSATAALAGHRHAG